MTNNIPPNERPNWQQPPADQTFEPIGGQRTSPPAVQQQTSPARQQPTNTWQDAPERDAPPQDMQKQQQDNTLGENISWDFPAKVTTALILVGSILALGGGSWWWLMFAWWPVQEMVSQFNARSRRALTGFALIMIALTQISGGTTLMAVALVGAGIYLVLKRDPLFE